MLNPKVSAEVLLDSTNPYCNPSERHITIATLSPKFLDAEIEKHGNLASNSSSSRAIGYPFTKMHGEIPYVPSYIFKPEKTMHGAELVDDSTDIDFAGTVQDIYDCTKDLLSLFEDKIHKQTLNRYLEPFGMQTKVITGSLSAWENFIELRTSEFADPSIRDLANLIATAIEESTPVERQVHIPMVTPAEYETHSNYECMMISSGRVAKYSYGVPNEEPAKTSIARAEMLVKHAHKSCFIEGTEILTIDGFIDFKDLTMDTLVADIDSSTGKFLGWHKPLGVINQQYDGDVYFYPNIDLGVTEDHRMIGAIRNTSNDSQSDDYSVYLPKESTSSKCKFQTKGEQRANLPSACFNKMVLSDSRKSLLGRLVGFWIGDGFCSGAKYTINIAKQRKIDYLENILNTMGIEYSKRKHCVTVNGLQAFKYTFNSAELDNLNLKATAGAPNKRIPDSDDTDFLLGVFDGLVNSDGSRKGVNQVVYSTVSDDLVDDIVKYSPIIGYTVSNVYKSKLGVYYVRLSARNHHIINDSRRLQSIVNITNYTGKVYCATVSGGGLVVRTSAGKVVVSGNCFEHTLIMDVHDFPDAVTHYDPYGNYYSGRSKNAIQFRKMFWRGLDESVAIGYKEVEQIMYADPRYR